MWIHNNPSYRLIIIKATSTSLAKDGKLDCHAVGGVRGDSCSAKAWKTSTRWKDSLHDRRLRFVLAACSPPGRESIHLSQQLHEVGCVFRCCRWQIHCDASLCSRCPGHISPASMPRISPLSLPSSSSMCRFAQRSDRGDPPLLSLRTGEYFLRFENQRFDSRGQLCSA